MSDDELVIRGKIVDPRLQKLIAQPGVRSVSLGYNPNPPGPNWRQRLWYRLWWSWRA